MTIARHPFGPTLSQALTWAADAHEAEARAQRAAGNLPLADAHAQAARLARFVRVLGAPIEDSPESPTPEVATTTPGASSNP